MLSRRDFLALSGLAGAGALSGGSAGCRSSHEGVVRIGFMLNLTHAPAIVGVASGRIQQALGVRVEALSFRAGPRVVEALVGDAIDVGVAGPSAIVYTHARHGAGLLRVLSGCSSGGASFVVRADAGIHGPGDLRGKTFATPQIGTTQDIALRKYLKLHGYEPAERGGNVTVHALDATTIFTEMRRKQLDGAWLPEPWATRVVEDAHAVRLIDERDLWPNRRFPTALVAARGNFVEEKPALAQALVSAMAVEVDRALRLPGETCDAARAELSRLLGKTLPARLLHDAWPYIDYTTDPLAGALQALAEDATLLGLAPRSNCSTLFAPIAPLAPKSGRPS